MQTCAVRPAAMAGVQNHHGGVVPSRGSGGLPARWPYPGGPRGAHRAHRCTALVPPRQRGDSAPWTTGGGLAPAPTSERREHGRRIRSPTLPSVVRGAGAPCPPPFPTLWPTLYSTHASCAGRSERPHTTWSGMRRRGPHVGHSCGARRVWEQPRVLDVRRAASLWHIHRQRLWTRGSVREGMRCGPSCGMVGTMRGFMAHDHLRRTPA
jgi:hypothetical protein